MDKIFHVFVSSTYSDLKEERKKVSEAVAKAGFVAEGMEIFPASSQKQMSFIERVIDRCDYYILILAGRYGSLAEDGLSYTEKELRYAKSKRIPVLAFVRSDLDSLPANKLENDPEKRQKLNAFIDALKNDTLVDFWGNPDDLSTKALAALSQARVTFEGVGWIRADTAASRDILSEINELRKENAELRANIAASKPLPIFDNIKIAGLDEDFELHITTKWGQNSSNKRSVLLSWRTIIGAIGSNYRTPNNTSRLDSALTRAIVKAADLGDHVSISIDQEDKDRILMQMEAFGMMRAAVYNRKSGGQGIFHQLTDRGLAQMLRENVVKSTIPEINC